MKAMFVKIQLVTESGCKSTVDDKNHLVILLAGNRRVIVIFKLFQSTAKLQLTLFLGKFVRGSGALSLCTGSLKG